MHPRGVGHPYRRRLRADSRFFLELQFCNDHGIPHSTFLAWDPDDRAKAIAFIAEKAEHCTMCGTAPWEWDPKQGGNRRAYEPVEHFCPGCYAKAALQHADPGRNMDGITIVLVPNDRGVDAARRHVKAKKRAR